MVIKNSYKGEYEDSLKKVAFQLNDFLRDIEINQSAISGAQQTFFIPSFLKFCFTNLKKDGRCTLKSGQEILSIRIGKKNTFNHDINLWGSKVYFRVPLIIKNIEKLKEELYLTDRFLYNVLKLITGEKTVYEVYRESIETFGRNIFLFIDDVPQFDTEKAEKKHKNKSKHFLSS